MEHSITFLDFLDSLNGPILIIHHSQEKAEAIHSGLANHGGDFSFATFNEAVITALYEDSTQLEVHKHIIFIDGSDGEDTLTLVQPINKDIEFTAIAEENAINEIQNMLDDDTANSVNDALSGIFDSACTVTPSLHYLTFNLK